MNCEGLEQLGPLADSFRMLDDDPDSSGAGAVSDLDPVAANAGTLRIVNRTFQNN